MKEIKFNNYKELLLDLDIKRFGKIIKTTDHKIEITPSKGNLNTDYVDILRNAVKKQIPSNSTHVFTHTFNGNKDRFNVVITIPKDCHFEIKDSHIQIWTNLGWVENY